MTSLRADLRHVNAHLGRRIIEEPLNSSPLRGDDFVKDEASPGCNRPTRAGRAR
jgi:hypothetical protein